MNTIIISITLLPVIYGQFNTNPVGQFSNYEGKNPFGGGQNQGFGNRYDFQQPSYSGQNNFRQEYLNRGYNNELSNNPYNNMYQTDTSDGGLMCPLHWEKFGKSCYRFIKSPLRARNDARKNCQASHSDLVSIDSLEEHGFLIYQLLWRDPQHRKWYTSIRQQSPSYWVNDGDGSALYNMENAFLPGQEHSYGRDFLVYSYSPRLKMWGFEAVTGEELLFYICEVPLAKLHYMTVDDRTHEYGLTIDDPEKVPRGPYFIRQPQNIVFDLSNTKVTNDVTLRCLAGGYPTPTYEWFKETYENDVSSAIKIDPLAESRYTISGGNLIIYDPKKEEDRGSYHCKASNKFGSILSESITLSFVYIGEFNLQRSAEGGSQYWGKALYCDPPPFVTDVNYKWTRDFFPNFVEEDRRVFVSNDGALYFSALQMELDGGNYSCTVQSKVSAFGRTGPFFQLVVSPFNNHQKLKFPKNFPKVFPEAPIAGRDIRLECFAFGYPVPSYNWTRRGAPLPRGAIITNFNRVLILPQATVEDQGEYVCGVSNDLDATSNSIYVSIQAEPNFTVPLDDKHLDYNGELTWTCEAFGIPDVNYTWFKNGELLQPKDLPDQDRERYFIQDSVLRIKYLNPERDSGMYQCRANNQLKTRYSSAQLRVLSFKPSFEKRPLEAETYAGEGGNVTIICNPEAAPRPTFVWKKNNKVIGGEGRRRILENGNLIISPVSRDDEGVYTCMAKNEYGMDESRGLLMVLRAPRMVTHLPPQVTVSVWDNFSLQCEAVNDELLDTAYIWTHNGMRIVDGDPAMIRLIPDGGTLNVVNTTLAEAGEYECVVISVVGTISSKTTVYVRGPPGPPGGVQATITGTSATIQWTDGASNGRPILFYNIGARTDWNSTWVNLTTLITAREIDRYNGRKEARLNNVLSPWSKYEFRVLAVNEIGPGYPSLPSPKYSTPPASPNKPPSNIGGGGGKIGDLTIRWTPLPPEDQNGPGIYYKIFWRRLGTNREFEFKELKEYGNVGSAIVRIDSLYYYTEYEVKVQAINSLGKGPESAIHVIYSAEEMPLAAPQQVSARSYNSTALNVSWIPVEMRREIIRGQLVGHRLKYWKTSQQEYEAVYYLSRSLRSWSLIVGLQPDTYYYVKVMVYNNAGEGPESERFIERTYRKAPQKPPSSVHVMGINPSTIKVVWRYVSPSHEEEPIIGYKVRIWEVDQDMSTANDTIILVGSHLEAYIDNLTPGKQYHLRVLAFSNGGDGRMSSPTHTFQMGPTLAQSNSQAEILPNFVVAIFTILAVLILNRDGA